MPRAVLHECDDQAAVRFRGLTEAGVAGVSKPLFAQGPKRAIERGEVRAGVLGELVLDVVPARVTHRPKVCGSEWTGGGEGRCRRPDHGVAGAFGTGATGAGTGSRGT